VWEKGPNFASGRITDVSQQMTDIRFDLHWPISFF
jgi:hypothetical protein